MHATNASKIRIWELIWEFGDSKIWLKESFDQHSEHFETTFRHYHRRWGERESSWKDSFCCINISIKVEDFTLFSSGKMNRFARNLPYRYQSKCNIQHCEWWLLSLKVSDMWKSGLCIQYWQKKGVLRDCLWYSLTKN